MINEKTQSLKSLFESYEGTHISVYISNNGDIDEIKSQLSRAKNEIYEFLYDSLNAESRKKIMEPFESLLMDTSILKKMNSNIGIFRNSKSFRILNLPIQVNYQCHVATSFHVKPLLKWLQIDREYLLLGYKDQSLELYYGNQTSLKKIDVFLLPSHQMIKKNKLKSSSFHWLNDWMLDCTQNFQPKLFLAGPKNIMQQISQILKYPNLVSEPISTDYNESMLSDINQKIRNILYLEARSSISKSLLEFHIAEDFNLTEKNIFEIAKTAVQGKVKKLIVAEELNIHGTINRKNGDLNIHPYDLDHKDDDLLDDLAQNVLLHGGQVIVAPRSQIPDERPIMAIVEKPKDVEILKNNNQFFLNGGAYDTSKI